MMHGNWGWGTGMGFGYGGGIVSILLIALIVVGGFFLIRWIIRRTDGGGISLGGPSSQDPENILKERYAKGEISREEYLNMLSDMKNDSKNQ
ncbi:MAG: SHOCT domain-containing protein [Spirochaeta sp.]|jgi:putative membrane protein|nr:SHOCT domain-containing protein [Spirochaeta sp.]